MEVPALVNVVLASCTLHNICEMKKPIFYPTVQALVGFDETDAAEADAQDIREALVDHITREQLTCS